MWLNKKCQPKTEIPVYRKILEMNAENMQKLLGHFLLFVGHKEKSGKYSENLMKICQKGTRESTAHNRICVCGWFQIFCCWPLNFWFSYQHEFLPNLKFLKVFRKWIFEHITDISWRSKINLPNTENAISIKLLKILIDNWHFNRRTKTWKL